MPEVSTTPEPQGSTVLDAAEALEARWTAAEQAAETAPPEEPKAEEVPETEAEPEADVTEEASEEAEPEPENVATLYTVKVDGEERQVPVEELVKGYQFGADYTRKTQKLAEQRRQADSELEAAKQERALYAQLLPAIQEVLKKEQEPPDFDKLYQENPLEAVKLEREWRKRQELVQQTRAEQQRLNQIQQTEQEKTLKAKLAEEQNKLMDAIPEWKDAKKAEAEKKELVQAAIKAGYAEDELANVTDHRAIVLLRKAMLYDKMQATRATLKPATPIVRPAKPGAAPPQKEVSEITRAKQRLAKTGSVTDAAAVIEKMLT